MITEELVTKIKQALENETQIVAAYVVGSIISKRETTESDFDLAIVVDKKRESDTDKIYDLVRDISFPKDLDLSVVDQSSSPLFLFQIIKGQRIYERNNTDAMAFEAFALHNYYDTQHIRDIYYESLKNKFSYVN
ncbi:MAG: nucleotidyltransferase domain-containing protein [Patescibacteria group bacterium]